MKEDTKIALLHPGHLLQLTKNLTTITTIIIIIIINYLWKVLLLQHIIITINSRKSQSLILKITNKSLFLNKESQA